MNSLARADAGPGDAPGPEALRPSSLLAAAVEQHPHRMAFGDQPDREAWSGRPRIAWTYANANHIVERLATFLSGLSLAPGTPVGICLPNGSEACVSILAVERADYLPCLLPAGWDEETLGEAVEAAHLGAVICQSRLAEERPSEAFCRLAARYFGLRFVCAFGPQVPDGVIDLDRAILDTEVDLPPLPGDGHAGLVTFELRGGAPMPLFRPLSSVIAAAAHVLVAQAVEPGERILSLLAPDDHRSLTTGLMAALVAGASLDSLGLFDAASLDAFLRMETRTHLVVPAFMERHLAQAPLPACVASTVLVHEAPVRFKAKGDLKGAVTDVLGFGERASLARARSASGHLAVSLETDALESGPAGELLRVRREEDGTVSFAGPAAEIYPLRRGAPAIPAKLPEWHPSGFKADLFAGLVIGVR